MNFFIKRRYFKIWIPIVTLIYLYSIRNNLLATRKSKFNKIISSKHNYRIESVGNSSETNNICATNKISYNFKKWINKAKDYKHPDCSASSSVIIENDGTVRYDQRVSRCSYRVLKWNGDDFRPAQGSIYRDIKDGQQLDTNEEFFNINCKVKLKRNIKGEYKINFMH